MDGAWCSHSQVSPRAPTGDVRAHQFSPRWPPPVATPSLRQAPEGVGTRGCNWPLSPASPSGKKMSRKAEKRPQAQRCRRLSETPDTGRKPDNSRCPVGAPGWREEESEGRPQRGGSSEAFGGLGGDRKEEKERGRERQRQRERERERDRREEKERGRERETETERERDRETERRRQRDGERGGAAETRREPETQRARARARDREPEPETETGRQTETARQTDTESQRQSQRQGARARDRETDRDSETDRHREPETEPETGRQSQRRGAPEHRADNPGTRGSDPGW